MFSCPLLLNYDVQYIVSFATGIRQESGHKKFVIALVVKVHVREKLTLLLPLRFAQNRSNPITLCMHIAKNMYDIGVSIKL